MQRVPVQDGGYSVFNSFLTKIMSFLRVFLKDLMLESLSADFEDDNVFVFD